MDKMNFSAKTILSVCVVLTVTIMSSLIMSACNRVATPQVDVPNHTTQNQTTAAETISAEPAKEKALSHAGVSPDTAKWYRAELDRDDGRLVYEIEFDAAGYEYNYEIDASSGEIMKFDKEIK